jgi:hypothetical protein
MTNPADSFFGESSPSAKFDAIGTTVGGVITRIGDPMQQTDFSSGKPLTWDDGTPRMQLPVTVQTDLRDPSNPLDDGKRTLYVKGEMKKAIGAALRAAGTKMALGGTLTVTFSGEEPTAGYPKKLYTATYAAPAPGGAFFEEPAAPVAAAHVGAPPAAPAPAPAAPAPAGVPAGVDPAAWAAFQAMQAQAAQAAPAAPPLDAQNAAYAAQMGFQAPQQ